METKRFKNAYNALLKAYFEGTLGKWSCAACACGNIIAEANNCRLTTKEFNQIIIKNNYDYANKKEEKIENLWFSQFGLTGSEKERDKKDLWLIKVNEAGYTGYEFWEIEKAFEDHTKIRVEKYKDSTEQEILEDQFNGLSAVVDVLLELDNIPNENKAYNNKFREHPKLELINN